MCGVDLAAYLRALPENLRPRVFSLTISGFCADTEAEFEIALDYAAGQLTDPAFTIVALHRDGLCPLNDLSPNWLLYRETIQKNRLKEKMSETTGATSQSWGTMTTNLVTNHVIPTVLTTLLMEIAQRLLLSKIRRKEKKLLGIENEKKIEKEPDWRPAMIAGGLGGSFVFCFSLSDRQPVFQTQESCVFELPNERIG